MERKTPAMMSTTRLTGLTRADLTTAERALLRLLVSDWTLDEAAPALGLTPQGAERLLAIAVLNVWL